MLYTLGFVQFKCRTIRKPWMFIFFSNFWRLYSLICKTMILLFFIDVAHQYLFDILLEPFNCVFIIHPFILLFLPIIIFFVNPFRQRRLLTQLASWIWCICMYLSQFPPLSADVTLFYHLLMVKKGGFLTSSGQLNH